MLRKDLLMRQFEEFGKVMAVILGFKKQKDWEKFQNEIADASKKFTSFEIGHVEGLSIPDFEKEIVDNTSLLSDQQKILADLLFEKMNYYGEQGQNERSKDLGLKCKLLYKKFAENLTQNQFNLDVHYKLEILNRIT